MTSIPVQPAGQRYEGQADERLIFRPLLAVDIQGYSARSPRMQLQAQRALRNVMEAAAGQAGLDSRLWFRQQAGDGELAVLPEDIDVATVVGVFVPALQAELERLNRAAGPQVRLRVRLALHHGPLILGGSATFGPAGHAPVVVSRLLDARPLRLHLRAHPDIDLAVIVSEGLYRDVICSGFCALAPEDFRPVRPKIKGVAFQGYIYDPGRAQDGADDKMAV
jgi:class 3 adenylate cyclase